jgi:hypothetical protein
MTTLKVPAGEFTFQNLCDANPSEWPLALLKFLSEQTTQGKLAKTKEFVASGTRVTYIPIHKSNAVGRRGWRSGQD